MGFIVVQNRLQCFKSGTQFISDTQILYVKNGI